MGRLFEQMLVNFCLESLKGKGDEHRRKAVRRVTAEGGRQVYMLVVTKYWSSPQNYVI